MTDVNMDVNEDEHTPGPWQYEINKGGTAIIEGPRRDGDNNGFGYGGVAVVETTPLTTVGPFPESKAEDLANVRLITAAPDMLATLRDVLDVYTAPTHNGHRICLGCGAVLTMWEQHSENCTIGRVQAMLAKAEGKGDTE